MKLIIDIDEKVLEHIKIQEISLSEIDVVCESIANGKPHEERPQGEWLESDVPESTLAKCSICGFDCGAYTHNYCSNCGAKMFHVEHTTKGDRK